MNIVFDALPESASRALVSIVLRPLPGREQAPGRLCVIEFDAAAFDPAAFEDAGIVRPATIGRSVPSRQAEFFFGRLAARRSLAALGITGHDVPIGPSREPVWPGQVAGSITHNHAFAAAVTLPGCPGVGIDIEKLVSPDSLQALLATAISAREQAYLKTLAADLPFEHLVTAVFSAKESFFKAAFPSVGRYFDFSAAEVVHIEPGQRSLSLVVREALSPAFFPGRVVQLRMDYLRPDTLLTSFVASPPP